MRPGRVIDIRYGLRASGQAGLHPGFISLHREQRPRNGARVRIFFLHRYFPNPRPWVSERFYFDRSYDFANVIEDLEFGPKRGGAGYVRSNGFNDNRTDGARRHPA